MCSISLYYIARLCFYLVCVTVDLICGLKSKLERHSVFFLNSFTDDWLLGVASSGHSLLLPSSPFFSFFIISNIYLLSLNIFKVVVKTLFRV